MSTVKKAARGDVLKKILGQLSKVPPRGEAAGATKLLSSPEFQRTRQVVKELGNRGLFTKKEPKVFPAFKAAALNYKQLLAGAGLLGAGGAAGYGIKSLQGKPQPKPAMSPMAKKILDFLGSATTLSGAAVGGLAGLTMAQQARQPMPGYGRPIQLSKRPGELVPGTVTGAAAGAAVANMLRNVLLKDQVELERIQ